MSTMIIRANRIKNKTCRRIVEHFIYLAILFFFIPSFLCFEILVVLPTIAEEWSATYIVHLVNAAFLLLNIVGNMFFGMLTDSSIKGRKLNVHEKDDWTFCSVCECFRPPRAWHCDLCDICVLKRDHHCTFFACCVGYYNQRYFMCFVFHVFVAMMYSFYYNVKFLAPFIKWNHGLLIMKFIFPIASIAVDFGEETIYVTMLVLNLLVACFTGFLFFFHLNNILQGKTTPEVKLFKKRSKYNRSFKSNLIEVFGTKWYLTWLCPFVNSPLVGNGMEWNDEATHDKNK